MGYGMPWGLGSWGCVHYLGERSSMTLWHGLNDLPTFRKWREGETRRTNLTNRPCKHSRTFQAQHSVLEVSRCGARTADHIAHGSRPGWQQIVADRARESHAGVLHERLGITLQGKRAAAQISAYVVYLRRATKPCSAELHVHAQQVLDCFGALKPMSTPASARDAGGSTIIQGPEATTVLFVMRTTHAGPGKRSSKPEGPTNPNAESSQL